MNYFKRDGALKDSQMAAPWEFLMEKRTLFLQGDIYGDIVSVVASQAGAIPTPQFSLFFVLDALLSLDQLSDKPIKLFIDSMGGSIEDGLVLYDQIQMVRSPVYTIARGACASMGAILLASGAAGHRYIFPSSRAMLHLPWGAVAGTRKAREVKEKRMRKTEERIFEVIKKHCNKPDNYTFEQAMEEWSAEADESLWLNPSEAVAYSLVDHIITPDIYKELFPFNLNNYSTI